MAKKVFVSKIDKNSSCFYQIMGPFFGSRQMAKEVGIQPFDDDGKIWFVSMIGDKSIGVASLNGRVVSDCWVLPDYRNNGVFSSLLDSIVRNTGENLKANCTNMSRGIFAKFGFLQTKQTKNYTMMELNRA